MALYERNIKLEMVADFVRAFVLGAVVFGYFEFREYIEMPKVQTTIDGKCVRVINYKNGDAYQCHDVGVILRRYRSEAVIVTSQEPEAPAAAATPQPKVVQPPAPEAPKAKSEPPKAAPKK